MSNVLIKGMEMPENCCDCDFESYPRANHYCQLVMRGIESLDRPEWCPLVPGEPQETVISLMTTITKLTAVINDLTKNKDRVIVKMRCKNCEYDGTLSCIANTLANVPEDCIKMSDGSSLGFCAWGIKREDSDGNIKD